ISLAGVDPDGIGYLTVPRADGTTAYLPSSDFADPPPFPEGPALVWVDVNSTHFFRPVLNSEEANAADNIASVGGEALQIGIHDGALLRVEGKASPASPDAKESVTFSASAERPLAGEKLSFRWSFGDGSSAEGATVRHAFQGTGTYQVTVAARGSMESGGESA